ncbi:MAG: secondary thiamine-phosphate synthase enzyme YjbQ [Fastidiosipilaceae bacterium]|nr:YjbQ family protein [Clostridiaceae bacterium]
MFKAFTLTTDKEGMYRITDEVASVVHDSGIREGICVVFCPHTTGAITINENADPDVKTDLMHGLNNVYPKLRAYRHMEGNSDAHLKSSCVGASEVLIVNDGKLMLGIWQGIYFMEFDGPRNRTFYVKVIPSN